MPRRPMLTLKLVRLRVLPFSRSNIKPGLVLPAPADFLYDQVFIASKNSALLFDCLSFSNRNSIPSVTPIGLRTRRSTHIFDKTALSTRSSSLRVPDLPISSDGNVRLSA